MSPIHCLFYANCRQYNNPHNYAVGEFKVKENSLLDLAFGKDYNLNFVEAHSCLQTNTDMKSISRHTTVNDIIQMAGCLDPKIFVNCLLYVQDEVFDKDPQVKIRVETNAKVGFEYSCYMFDHSLAMACVRI